MQQSNQSYLLPNLTAPFQQMGDLLLANQQRIEAWFKACWDDTMPPFYASVDLRNAGYKIAPIDTNLFPAGFNNLNLKFATQYTAAIQEALLAVRGDKILIIPENHTRNLFYLESLAILKLLLEQAGFETHIGSLAPGLSEKITLASASKRQVVLAPVCREQGRIKITGFDPDIILLNHDLASGQPEILNNIQQTIIPPAALGWSLRLKSDHFAYYKQVASEFAALVDIDPWLIDPVFSNCGEVDFIKHEGVDCLTRNVAALFASIASKYQQYQVSDPPFVMVKADAGTYGMGVMPIYDVAEINALNRKKRTKMAKTKEGQKVTKVIIQEGVYTHEIWEQQTVAEPVLYMFGSQVVGGFYRIHKERSSSENLNAPGMVFKPFTVADFSTTPSAESATAGHYRQGYTYGVIARLALLAAAREMANV